MTCFRSCRLGNVCLSLESRKSDANTSEGGGAPVYGPVLGTPATPEAVGGRGRRVWLLRTARVQRAREAPPWGRGGGVIPNCDTKCPLCIAPPCKMYGVLDTLNSCLNVSCWTQYV